MAITRTSTFYLQSPYLSIFHLGTSENAAPIFVCRKIMIAKRQSFQQNRSDAPKSKRTPEPRDPNLSPCSNPAHLQLFFKAAGCLDASIVQGQDLKGTLSSFTLRVSFEIGLSKKGLPRLPLVYDRLRHCNPSCLDGPISVQNALEMRAK